MKKKTKPLKMPSALRREIVERVKEDIFAKADRLVITNPDISLHLNTSGDLWRYPQKRYLYSMRANAASFLVLRHLAQFRNNGLYISTAVLTQLLHNKFPSRAYDDTRTREVIKDIKKKIKKHLLFDDVIEGKSGSGYRINPKYEFYLDR